MSSALTGSEQHWLPSSRLPAPHRATPPPPARRRERIWQSVTTVMANGYGPETAKLSLWFGNGNRLGVGVAVNSFSAELTTIAAALDAAERRERVHRVALIDTEGAGAHAFGDDDAALDVVGPDRAGKAIVGIVCDT